jgi:hypothetical protein
VFGRSFGDVVDVVGAVGVGELLRAAVVDLREDERGKGRCLRRGRGGAFGEDGGAVGNASARESQLKWWRRAQSGMIVLEQWGCWSR